MIHASLRISVSSQSAGHPTPRRPIGGFLFGRLGTRRIGLPHVAKLAFPLGLARLALLQPLPRLLGQGGIGLLLRWFSHWRLQSIRPRYTVGGFSAKFPNGLRTSGSLAQD